MQVVRSFSLIPQKVMLGRDRRPVSAGCVPTDKRPVRTRCRAHTLLVGGSSNNAPGAGQGADTAGGRSNHHGTPS